MIVYNVLYNKTFSDFLFPVLKMLSLCESLLISLKNGTNCIDLCIIFNQLFLLIAGVLRFEDTLVILLIVAGLTGDCC